MAKQEQILYARLKKLEEKYNEFLNTFFNKVEDEVLFLNVNGWVIFRKHAGDKRLILNTPKGFRKYLEVRGREREEETRLDPKRIRVWRADLEEKSGTKQKVNL